MTEALLAHGCHQIYLTTIATDNARNNIPTKRNMFTASCTELPTMFHKGLSVVSVQQLRGGMVMNAWVPYMGLTYKQ